MVQYGKNVVWLLIIVSTLMAQRDFDEELKFQNKSILLLKKEMEELRHKIKTMTSRQASTLKKLGALEKEISLTDRLISELTKEEELTKQLIIETENKINEKELQLKTLRQRYKKRVVHVYTKGRPSFLKSLFSPVSWRQGVYRKEYLKIVSAEDRKIKNNINSLLIEIGLDKLNMEAGLRKTLSLSREKTKHKKGLQKKQITRKTELITLKKNKTELDQYLKEKQKGLKELESLRETILEDKARFAREERIRRQQEALKLKQFSQLKGQLPWPIHGKVVTKFGRQWNPKLKTTTEYPGIDIAGKANIPVKTVLSGIVATITYLRGFGTTVIIDHGGGFYTVYSQLTSLKTHVNSEVRSGDVIAHLADSDTNDSPALHFEIWGNGKKLNPEKWLTK